LFVSPKSQKTILATHTSVSLLPINNAISTKKKKKREKENQELQSKPNGTLKKEPKHVCHDFKQPHEAISKQRVNLTKISQVKPTPF
jgi:hypothetical protein